MSAPKANEDPRYSGWTYKDSYCAQASWWGLRLRYDSTCVNAVSGDKTTIIPNSQQPSVCREADGLWPDVRKGLDGP
jgi:hypothetical protein